jgi:hypothetical protein
MDRHFSKENIQIVHRFMEKKSIITNYQGNENQHDNEALSPPKDKNNKC